jgi:hypothetical protein
VGPKGLPLLSTFNKILVTAFFRVAILLTIVGMNPAESPWRELG